MDQESKQIHLVSNAFYRYLLIIAGTISLGLGIIGIILPLLPTTPFLLLAAACYIRSSKRFYNWLVNNKWFGQYIKNYHSGKGIPLKIKSISITVLWITIITTIIFFLTIIWIRIILLIIAVTVSIHIYKIKTYKK